MIFGKVMWVGRGRLFVFVLLAVTAAMILGYATKAHAAPGYLDTSFDTDGKVTTDFVNHQDEGRALALQEDGKIVVAGYAYASFATGFDFAVARYNQDGTLDTSFGTDGKVTTPIGLNRDKAHAIAVRADGKIVVAGEADGSDNGWSDHDIAVARYNPNGTLDTTFGGDGIVITNVGGTDIAYDLTVQGNYVLVTGQASGVTESDMALVRYDDNGTLDNSFGSGGMVKTDFFSHADQGRAVTLQADGKIVVAGYTSRPVDPNNTAAYEYNDFALARYNPNGTLDTTFDTDGKVTTQFLPGSSEEVQDVAVQEDGKIVAGGGVYDSIASADHAALARYDANGALDTTFDTDGKVMIDNFGETYYGKSSALALQDDGKIIFAGASAGDFALARLNTNGTLDTSFDTDGKLTTDFFGSSRGVAVQDDGKIVAAGYTHNGTANNDFALARYYGGNDATPPLVNPPVQTLIKNSTLGTTNVPVKLSWSATDSESGVSHYELQKSTDGGAYQSVTLTTPTTRSITLSLSPAHKYRFRVLAHDNNGNFSEWRYGPAFTVLAHRESSASISYSGTWRQQSMSSAYGGAVKYATARGATARLTFTGRSVAWVAPKSKTRGKAEVYLDGRKVATVDLYSATALSRKVIYSANGLNPSVSHTLQVKVLGTTGRPRVDVDAFVVLR